jgi:hypothetical protein
MRSGGPSWSPVRRRWSGAIRIAQILVLAIAVALSGCQACVDDAPDPSKPQRLTDPKWTTAAVPPENMRNLNFPLLRGDAGELEGAAPADGSGQ